MLNQKEKTAISFGGQQIGFGELHARITGYAGLMNIEKGDRVVIFSENRPSWIYSLYAIWVNNGVAVPVDFMSTPEDVAYIIKDCTPKLIAVSTASLGVMEKAIALASVNVDILLIDTHEADEVSHNGFITLQPQQDNTALIIYTSGTTGNPKGVMLSFENIMANVTEVSVKIPILTGEQRIIALLPMHHVLPMVGTIVAPMFSGATVAISPSMASEDIIKTLQDNKITVIIGVPRLYSAIRKGIMDKVNASKIAKALFKLAQKVNNPSFSKKIFGTVHRKFGGHLRFMVSGGAALDPQICSDFLTLGFDVLEGYGMTEAAPMITFTRPRSARLGSAGQSVTCSVMEVREGEIVVKGSNVMKGYYNKPAETAEVIKDGWLYTGDLGYIDKDGYLFITGRKKEIIILSNGKNINPSELEQKLVSVSPLIAEAGIFQKGDKLHAVLVPNRAHISASESDNLVELIRNQVMHEYNRQVPPYKKVMAFSVYEGELPKTRLGKIKRFQLADLVTASPTTQRQDELAGVQLIDEFKMIQEYIEREKDCSVLPSDHIEFDLGLDSLDKISFQVFIDNSFGVNIAPEELVKFESVMKLAEFVKEHRSRMHAEKVDWAEIIREKVHLKIPESWFTNRIIVKFSKWFFQTYFRFRSVGVENLPEGPCILAPNHQSFFDGLLVTAYLRSRQVRKTYFYAKEKHVRTRLLRFIAKKNNVIVMDLQKDLKQSIQKMAEVLRNNKYLVIFPEGTRSDNGVVGDFKKTFAILSRELNVPVVPVSIHGAIDALPKGSIFPRPFKRICVEYLKPVYPGDHSYDTLTGIVKQEIVTNQQMKNKR